VAVLRTSSDDSVSCISGILYYTAFWHNEDRGLAPAAQRIFHRDSPGGAAELYTRGRSLLSSTALLRTAYFVCKSSAVAEIGDRARAKWAEKCGGAAVPLSVGELGPHLT